MEDHSLDLFQYLENKFLSANIFLWYGWTIWLDGIKRITTDQEIEEGVYGVADFRILCQKGGKKIGLAQATLFKEGSTIFG